MADLDDMIAAKSRASWDGCAGCGRDTNTAQAAKDEIERLLSEVEIYENALRKITECPQIISRADGMVDTYWNPARMVQIAEEALKWAK